jgi:dUTPase
MMMNGESKDPSQIIYPSDSMSSSTSAIHSINDVEKKDYCVFLKVSDEFDQNYTDEERKKLIEFYMEKISLHEKSKYVKDQLNRPVKNTFKDSGFDLVVPWVKDCACEQEGIYVYKPEQKKLCNLRVQIAVYKVRSITSTGIGSLPYYMEPSPYYLYARSSIYKTPFSLANNVGIIDTGYRGNLCAALHNTTSNSYSLVKMGTRMTQICMPDLSPNFHVRLVNKLSDTSRGTGGFGSTGQ